MDEPPCNYWREPLGFAKKTATRIRHKNVRIHHPAYPPGATLLLGFPGLDSSSGGIDFNFVHTACAIVADNRFDGYLSLQSLGDAQPLERTSTLNAGDYYFHVPPPTTSSSDEHDRQPHLYPVVASFRCWTFPDANLWTGCVGELWASSISMSRCSHNPSACVLTGHTNAVDDAHIIPSGEGQWLLNNDMGEYISESPSGDGNSLIDDRVNMVTLRADIHRLWDSKDLTFVPKRVGKSVCMYAHCKSPDEQLVELYHNRPLLNLAEMSPECFFARFAWSLFPLTRFLTIDTCKRLLRIRNESGEIQDREFNSREAMQFLSLSRSTSPRKRKQAEGSQSAPRHAQNESRYVLTRSGCKRIRRQSFSASDSGFASGHMTDSSYDEELRGRPRKRRCDLPDLQG